jgi:DNA-binding transcriptional regulator YbjK
MAADNGRTGRRPGSNPTKQEILEAAREAFAVRGSRGAAIRAIAESADVDPGLVHHYFKTKQDLSSVTTCLAGPDPGVRFQLAMGHLLGIVIATPHPGSPLE